MKKSYHRLTDLSRNVWLFPILLLSILVILTLCKVSGTSIGIYHELLYGNSKDTQLITGHPRAIRSDEWGLTTPATVGQVNENYPMVNATIGNGQNMAITLDVPYIGWGTLFKPQNWAFLLMPLEYAFAFRWWLIAVMLMIGCYFFTLTLLPKKYLIASLLSVCLFFSPFIQWWYLSGTILPIAFSLYIAGLATLMLRNNLSKRLLWLLAIGLTYALACLAFVLYAPFLIASALALAAYIGGQILNAYTSFSNLKTYMKRVAWLVVPAIITAVILLLFLYSNEAVIKITGNTVYPGSRTEQSGGMELRQLLGGYFNFQLQNDSTASHLNLNQSEASNFIYIFPFLAPMFLYLFLTRKKLKISIDWRVIALFTVAAIYIVRFFVPASEWLFNLLQLNRIPHNRLLIGLGLINIFLLVIAIQHLNNLRKNIPTWLKLASSIFAFTAVSVTGILFKHGLQGYIESIPVILVVGLVIALIVWLVLSKRFILALALLAAFSIFSAARINPMYIGFGELTNSRLSKTITSIGDKDGKWVVGDNAAAFESLPSALGVGSISGVYAYPQLSIWQSIAKDKASEDVYNRYAHVFFSIEELTQPAQGQGAYLDPPALDAFRVHADPCSEFFKNQNVRYVLQTIELKSNCATKISEISYPNITFFIYKLNN